MASQNPPLRPTFISVIAQRLFHLQGDQKSFFLESISVHVEIQKPYFWIYFRAHE